MVYLCCKGNCDLIRLSCSLFLQSFFFHHLHPLNDFSLLLFVLKSFYCHTPTFLFLSVPLCQWVSKETFLVRAH